MKAFYLSFAVSAGLMFGVLFIAPGAEAQIFGPLAGTAVGLAGGIWACLSIRCPECGAKWLWQAVSAQKTGAWLGWLLDLESCPNCGNSGQHNKAKQAGDTVNGAPASDVTFKDEAMGIEIFGEIDPNNVEDYYEGHVLIDGRDVEVDLNFDSESVDKEVVDSVSEFLSSIDGYSKKAFEAISEDYDLNESSETARFYLQHHFDVASESEIKEVFGTLDIDKKTYFKALSLVRIGLYPEDDENYALFDIQLPEDFTNYLMSVVFDSSSNVTDITMES